MRSYVMAVLAAILFLLAGILSHAHAQTRPVTLTPAEVDALIAELGEAPAKHSFKVIAFLLDKQRAAAAAASLPATPAPQPTP